MRFSEFKYVGYKDSVSSKSLIYDINEVKTNENTENYQTIYRFTEAVKKHGSVRDIGPEELFYSDYLYFDIDREKLGEANKDVLKLTGFLHEYDIGYEAWLSGNKGYHVSIPTIQFGFTPTNDERILRRMAGVISESACVEIDKKIYNVSRVIRMPFSLHRKTGKRKVPWPKEDMEYPDPDDYLPNDTLTEIYQKVLKGLKQNKKLKTSKNSVVARIFSMAYSGDRNQGCFVRAKMLREHRFHVDDSLRFLNVWNNDCCKPPLSEKEIQRTVESAYRGDVAYIKKTKDRSDRIQTVSVSLSKVIDSYKNFNQMVVKTGIKFFDRYTLGLFPGDMLFWLAVNGNFKTAILSTFCQHISQSSGKYSILFSSDMPSEKLLPRHVAYADHISIKQAIDKLKKGTKPPNFLKQFEKVITINCPSLAVEDMYKDIEFVQSNIGEIGFIGVDYLGAMSKCDNDTKKTADTIHEIHSLIKTLGECPCMTLVQARREYEGSGGGNIEIDKVAGKDASAIEHKADFMLGSWWHGSIRSPERWGRFLKARQFDSENFMQKAYFEMDIVPEQMRLVNMKYRVDHPDFNQKKAYGQN